MLTEGHAHKHGDNMLLLCKSGKTSGSSNTTDFAGAGLKRRSWMAYCWWHSVTGTHFNHFLHVYVYTYATYLNKCAFMICDVQSLSGEFGKKPLKWQGLATDLFRCRLYLLPLEDANRRELVWAIGEAIVG